MQNENSCAGGLFSVIKAVVLSLICSFLAIIILACILRVSTMPDKAVYPIMQTLKVLFVLLSTLLFIRGEKGWLKGGEIGLMFTALSYVTYSVIGGNYALSLLVLAELFFTVFAGSVGGVVAVNVKK